MPILGAIAKKVAEMLAKKTVFDLMEKEKREKSIKIVVGIVATIILLFTFIFYILTNPLTVILNIMGVDTTSEVAGIFEEFKGDYGYIGANNRKIPLYIQTDKEYRDYPYAGDNLGISGCGVTSLAMVVSGLTGREVTPIEMAKYSTNSGYAVDGVGTSWGLMTTGARSFGLNAEEVSFDEDTILQNLSQGKVMITSMKPGIFTRTGHFIVLIGLDEEGKVKVNDSYSREISDMTFNAKIIAEQSKGAWAYSYTDEEKE